MPRALAVVLPLLAAVAGCGQQTVPSPEPGDAAGGGWRACGAAAFDQADGSVATLHLDAWTAVVTVKLPGQGPCAGGLVARGNAGVVGTDVAGLELEPASVQPLDAGLGRHVLVRVDGGLHPRGGFQPHLFLVGPDRVEEVTAGGAPVVPFVATDGGMAPMTVRCGAGTLDVLTATTSEPPGVVPAWDVRRTRYDLLSGETRRTGSERVREDVADPVLHRDLPALFDPGRLFDGC